MSILTVEATDKRIPSDREELITLMREVYREEKNAEGKKVLSLEQLKKEFLALPGEQTRDYEIAIASFARDLADSVIKKGKNSDTEPPIIRLLPKSESQIKYGSDEEKIAFAAFAVAVNYERLQKNSIEEGELLEQYREFFGKTYKNGSAAEKYEHIYFFHLDLLYRMGMAVGANDAFLTQLLDDAKTNSSNLSENYGGHHAYAETVALVFENASPKLRAELESAPEHWLDDAKTSVIKAIARDEGYAKFYCTYGRVQALCGEIDEAIKSINKAIALEKNTRTDYSIRIGQYSSYYQQFRAQQKLKLQEEAMAEQMREMTLAMEAQEKETMAKNMEFLGLFSGIVSFTIGSLTITGAIAEQSIKHAAGLIIVLMGALMSVFASFGMILHGFHKVKRDKKTQRFERSFIYRHLVVFLLGLLVAAGGVVFCLI